VFEDLETIEQLWASDEVFQPGLQEHDREALVEGWQKAVKATLYRASLDR
jgi:glycerol kinase